MDSFSGPTSHTYFSQRLRILSTVRALRKTPISLKPESRDTKIAVWSKNSRAFQMLIFQQPTKSLALKLQISPSTVKIHRKHIYQKLEITSQAELFSLFIQSLAIKELGDFEDPLSALSGKIVSV